MQTRRWSFKDDDKTRDINRWLTGILSPGLYFGFDFAPSANMNLTLNHNTTGFKDVDDVYPSPAESVFQSLIITRQGVIVKENASITINGIAVGDPTNPRIDILVVTHRINEVAGGETALYSIIQGTPAGSPVAPALTNANTQIKIGELFIPANTVALNGVGVTWTRAIKPGFSGLTLTPDRALISSPTGQIISSAITQTELSRLSGVSSNIQTQFSGKQDVITGAATTILTANLTANRVAVSNASGKVISSAVTDTELNQLIGINTGSTIQSQINGKQAIITGAATTIVSADLTADRALASNASGKVVVSAVTKTELERLAGVADGRVVTSLESAGLSGYKFRIKVIEIGDWNMDANDTVFFAHGLDASNIRFVHAAVRTDSGTVGNFPQLYNSVNPPGANHWENWHETTTISWNATNIILKRMDGNGYDNTSYDSTSYNRGWVTVGYEVVN